MQELKMTQHMPSSMNVTQLCVPGHPPPPTAVQHAMLNE